MHSNWQCAGALTKPLLYCQVEIKNLNSFSSVSRAIILKFQGRFFFIAKARVIKLHRKLVSGKKALSLLFTSCFYSSDVVETSTRFMVHFVILCLLYVPLACVKYFFENSYNEEKGRAF